jgi:hypothetical protein
MMTMESLQKLLVRAVSGMAVKVRLTRLYLARHQASMLRSLKEVQGDDSVVGFYQATTLGSFFNQTLVDTQAIHQEKLRHGGIVIVHGRRK